MVFYSPSTRAFYHQGLANAPTDAIEISAAEHAALLQGQAAGAQIISGDDGRPTLRDAQSLSPAEATARERAAMQATRFQVRAALLDVGLLEAVEALIPSLPQRAQLAWDHATTFDRLSGTLTQAAALLSPPLTDTDLDELFRNAMEITS